MPIPEWKKPPVSIPVQDLREFIAKYGPDVSVLTTWSHETNSYQFVTIGADKHYADAAVRLRDVLTKSLSLGPNGPNDEDLRHEHPNVKLSHEQLFFLLWLLGFISAQEGLSDEKQKFVEKYHDELLPLLGAAYEATVKNEQEKSNQLDA